MRVNIWMRPELHTKLKVISALKGITIQEFIESAIEGKAEHDKEMLRELLE